jgi:hypothetical protein
MGSLLSRAGTALVTITVCAVCWWIWTGDHALAWRLGLGELDLPVRVLAIFLALSLLDKLVAISNNFKSWKSLPGKK